MFLDVTGLDCSQQDYQLQAGTVRLRLRLTSLSWSNVRRSPTILKTTHEQQRISSDAAEESAALAHWPWNCTYRIEWVHY